MSDYKMSEASQIKALALINIHDIFHFLITATDEQIIKRYGDEENAINIAQKCMDIALQAGYVQKDIKRWEMKYSMPIIDSDERLEKLAYFYDGVKGGEDDDADI